MLVIMRSLIVQEEDILTDSHLSRADFLAVLKFWMDAVAPVNMIDFLLVH